MSNGFLKYVAISMLRTYMKRQALMYVSNQRYV